MINFALDKVRREASWLAYYAKQLMYGASLLTDLPDYPTRAEEALEEAETQLRRALAAVEAVRCRYEAIASGQMQLIAAE
jgi:hypothetical protein